jgi:ABC-type nickel/cobalt efflux system permease component RcnA
VLQVLTRGLLDANRVVVGIAIAIVALATLAYLVRRWR